jgi:hypothetical protein
VHIGLSDVEDEQTIVFETEMITPLCLFPLVLPTASVSLNSIDSGNKDDPSTVAEESFLVFGEEALLGPERAPSNPSIHLPPYKTHSDNAPIIPLDSRFAFHHRTVEMLPPATSPPRRLVSDTPQPFRSIPNTHDNSSHASHVNCCEPECWPAVDPLCAGFHHNFLDHGESQPTLANLLPIVSYGESQLTVDYGECLPAIKVPSKDLDKDGEITDALLLYGKDSPQSRACIVRANDCFHAHVSQVIGIHDKDLDNNGEITIKLISTIATDDPISNTPINHICSSVTPPCGNHPGHSIFAPPNTDPPDSSDTDATLLPTFKHGDSFED